MKTATRDKSISELDGWNWTGPVPSADASDTERRFYALHRTPIKDLELGDLAFLIRENSALEFLVPIALELLVKNAFIEGELYPGDLLCALFLINDEPIYWTAHPDQRKILVELFEAQKDLMPAAEMSFELIKKIKGDYKNFLAL